MTRVMLDTNMVSYIIKGDPPQARQRLKMIAPDAVTISSVTQAELMYGLAKKGHPPAFTKLIHAFLQQVNVLPWDALVANVYGDLRANCATAGITLGALDMMIAAHAVAADAILITHDKAFSQVPNQVLRVQDWLDN